MLFNGMQCTDLPPGQVGRYKHLRPGSWVSARLLTYVFNSFPRLWSSYSRSARQEANDDSFQYNWRGWVSSLEHMRKETGAWAVLAKYLVSRSSGVTYKDVTHIARAIIELAMRDAEIERNTLRNAPLRLPLHTNKRSSISGTDEQNFMARARSAVGYEPRVQKIEKCIYKALVWRDASVVFRISQEAPANCVVHSVVRGAR